MTTTRAAAAAMPRKRKLRRDTQEQEPMFITCGSEDMAAVSSLSSTVPSSHAVPSTEAPRKKRGRKSQKELEQLRLLQELQQQLRRQHELEQQPPQHLVTGTGSEEASVAVVVPSPTPFGQRDSEGTASVESISFPPPTESTVDPLAKQNPKEPN